MNSSNYKFKKAGFLLIPLNFWLFACLCFAQTLAPGAPGKDAQWATAGKQAVGTSANLESKVWFTLAQGVMTEVYYPDVTVANVHLLQFVVVNPKTKKVETEQEDATHKIESLSFGRRKDVSPIKNLSIYKSFYSESSLVFEQFNTAKSGDWLIRKTYLTDPENNSVLFSVDFQSSNPDLELYVFYDPSLGNSGMHDTGWTEGRVLFSADDQIASALLCGRCNFSDVTNGFLGVNDGLTQLRENGKIVKPFARAENGNLVQVAKVSQVSMGKYGGSMIFALGFGNTPKTALNSAYNTLSKGFTKNQQKYQEGWIDYLKKLPHIEPKYQAQFNMAAMQLKALEDKTVRGANIASLTVPWGGGDNANENNIGGYHLVWSRDLYQVFTAYMALGDTAAAERALDFLLNVQQKEDGSFPQNSYLDGKPFWGSLQMDEVAYPLIMAYQLKRFDEKTWKNHVKRAADFIVKTGPKTPQERWEEEGGYSPSTIAAEIAGLVCAAEIAKKNGDTQSTNLYLKTADEWQANIEKWTVTTTGKYSKEPYYVRITQNGTPDAGDKIELNNGAGFFDEREIVDAGFLELVRLGIKSPDDPIIQNSVKVIDEVIKVDTPNGAAFYRYNHDGYGEMDDGRRWNFDGKYTGKGRLWALLSGERGQYELARAEFFNVTNPLTSVVDDKGRLLIGVNKDDRQKLKLREKEIEKAKSRLEAMSKFANDGLMIPEQIWDSPNVPKNADKQFVPELRFGEGTGSATPLAWSMAQFIRLAVNLQEGRNLDTPDVVYERYVLGKKSEDRSQKSENQNGNLGYANLLGIYNRCWDRGPLFNSECSYVSTIAEENSQNPVLRECRLGGFFIPCKNNLKEMHACFNYQGEFKTLEIAGDFTNWKPVALKIRKEQDGRNWIDCFNFAKTARVEYKLIVDGKWITDPLNPTKIDNGVGGENSYFEMPDYKATVWDKEIEKSPLNPEVSELEIESKKFGKRTVKIYVPSEYYKRGIAPKLPVLYLQDGSEFIARAKAINVLENLVTAKKVEPFMIVFIDPQDRMKEYWANDDWADFMALEVVPAVENKYFSAIKTGRENRALLGASLGGITSFHTAIKYPETFSRVGGQSSSFWIDDERVVKEIEKLDSSKNKFKFYIDDGTLEGVEDSHKVVKILKDKGYDVTYIEKEVGHNWTAWRDRLAEAFIALWK